MSSEARVGEWMKGLVETYSMTGETKIRNNGIGIVCASVCWCVCLHMCVCVPPHMKESFAGRGQAT